MRSWRTSQHSSKIGILTGSLPSKKGTASPRARLSVRSMEGSSGWSVKTCLYVLGRPALMWRSSVKSEVSFFFINWLAGPWSRMSTARGLAVGKQREERRFGREKNTDRASTETKRHGQNQHDQETQHLKGRKRTTRNRRSLRSLREVRRILDSATFKQRMWTREKKNELIVR